MKIFNNRIKAAFENIYAEETLKKSTAEYLRNEINTRVSKKHRFYNARTAAVSVCAALVLLTTGVVFYGLYLTPEMYLDVDINPSAEFAVNRFGTVVSVSAYNKEAEDIIAELNLKNMNYKDAVKEFVNAAEHRGYINNGGLVSVTLQTGNKNTENTAQNEIRTGIESFLSEHHSNMTIEVFPVNKEIKRCSHDLNISPAKYLAINELMEVDPTATVEGCKGHSISNIRQMTKDNTSGHGNKHRNGAHG